MEVPAPSGGVLSETLAAEGDEVAIGAMVARIDESAAARVTVDPERERAGRPGFGGRSGRGAGRSGRSARSAALRRGSWNR